MTTRVLNSSLQLAATAWLWEATLVAAERRTRGALLFAGLAAGVATLANPTFAPLLLLLPAWLGWRTRLWRDAALAAVAGLVRLVPSTLHNRLASGEFIPLSAQSGLGFHHGNQPGASGIYKAAEGVSADRARQTAMAREAVRDRTDGSWSQTDRAYRDMALAWLAEDPARTAALELRKLWWFVGGRVYGDVYTPELEREDGRHALLWLAPLPLAWLTVPALFVALLVLARRPRELAPELLLFLATFMVVMVFWYSPRYRLPIAPFAAVAGAWLLLKLCDRAAPALLRAAAAVAICGSVVASAALRSSGSDAPDAFRANYLHNSGVALAQLGRHDEALREFERAEAAGSRSAAAARAEMLRRTGRVEDALRAAQAAVARDGADTNARRGLAIALAQTGRLPEAAAEFERVLAVDATDAEALGGLANVRLQQNDAAAAVVIYDRALRLAPDDAALHANAGRARLVLGEPEAAEALLRRTVLLDAALAPAHTALAEIALARGDVATAVAELRLAWSARPDAEAALALAWWLSVAPEPALHDAATALRALDGLRATHAEDPRWLDGRAAALARAGDWPAAQQAIARAVARAKELGYADALPDLETRAALYARREPYMLR